MANTLALAVKKFQAWRGDVAVELCAWMREDWGRYLISFLFHAALMLLVAIVMTLNSFGLHFGGLGTSISLEAPDESTQPDTPAVTNEFHIGQAPVEVTHLDIVALTQSCQPKQTAKYYSDDTEFEEPKGGRGADKDRPQLGGNGGFSVPNLAGIGGGGGLGGSYGHSDHAGPGGEGDGFGQRGKGRREALAGEPATPAPPIGPWWAASSGSCGIRIPNGSWQPVRFNRRCSGGACSARG